MKVSNVLIGATVGATLIVAAAGTAYAWHPKGEIVKKVQNVTQQSELRDANSVNDAVAAKPGDILKYVIEIKNTAANADKNWNDLAYIAMTDNLPAGVELTSDASKREIKENLGTLKPGKSVTRELTVKVTANTDGAIKNTACFTGDSEVKDNPQHGCDDAIVTVTVPEEEVPEVPETPVEETPEVPETPEMPKTETPIAKTVSTEMPDELPQTGVATTAVSILGVGSLAYAVALYVVSKRF